MVYVNNAVFAAAAHEDTSILRKFADKGIPLAGMSDETGTLSNLAHVAACSGSPETMQFLIDKGVDFMAMTKGIYLCSFFFFMSFAKKKGAWTPLRIAFELRRVDMVRLLLDQPAINANEPGSDGVLPLILAVRSGSPHMVAAVLAKNVDINKTDQGGL